MASLVGYSGSDSDSADEGTVENNPLSTRAPAEAHHHAPTGHPADVNKPKKCTAPEPGLGTESECTPTSDVPMGPSDDHDAVLPTQAGTAKDEPDYFGLDNDSSSDEEEGYFAKGNNIWSRPITLPQKLTKKQDPLPSTGTKNNTNDLSNDNVNHITNGAKSKTSVLGHSTILSGAQRIDLPISDFWTGNLETQDWHKPEKIWGSSQLGSSSKHSECKEYFPQHKRSKFEDLPGVSHQEQYKSGPLSKSCFFIHHKILPQLHQQPQNKPPTRRYICLEGHAGAVNRIKWAKPDYSHLIASASMDKTVRIWNTFSSVSSCVQTFCSHTKAVKDVTWSPSGKEVLSCGYDRTARLHDVVKGVEIGTFEYRDFLTCIKYHPVNPNYILAGSKDRVLCWDVRSPESCIKTFSYKHNFGQVQDLVFIQDGREFVISTDMVTQDSADRTIMVYDFGSGVVLSNQVYQERYVCPRLCVHPHQAEVMAQSGGNYMCLFSTIRPYKMNRCKRFEGHKVLGYSVGCDYSPDGRLVVSGSADSKVTVWDYQKAVPLKQLGDSNQIYLDVAWHPVLSSTVASSSWSGDIDIWQ